MTPHPLSLTLPLPQRGRGEKVRGEGKGHLTMRGVTDISGLRDLRSMHTTGQRSMHQSRGSAYLQLYMLRVERGRLEKEAVLLAKRSQGIQKRLEEVQKRVESLERSGQIGRSSNGGETATAPSAPAKKWKTFSVNY